MMAKKVRVLIVDDAKAVRESIKRMLELDGDCAVVGEAADGVEAVSAARRLLPDVILMDINLPRMDGISAATQILAEQETNIVMISVEGDREYLRRAMQAGAKDYLVKPFSSDELAQAIRRCGIFASGGGGGARGRVITVFSPKGGVGKSVLAANLAIALALGQSGKEVVLVDLDLEFGVLAVMLGQKPRSSIVDLCRGAERITPAHVRETLTPIPQLPVSLLAAPPSPHLAAEVDGEAKQERNRNYVEEAIQALRAGWDYVVIDTPANFREATMAALDLADVILVVTTPDIPSLQNTAKGLNILLNQLEYSPDRVKLVVNQAEPKRGLSEEDVASALEHPVFFSVPADPAVVVAVNMGQSLLGRRNRSQAGAAVARLAELLAGSGGEAVEGREGADVGTREGIRLPFLTKPSRARMGLEVK